VSTILDEIFVKLPSPPFTPVEKKLVAENVYGPMPPHEQAELIRKVRARVYGGAGEG